MAQTLGDLLSAVAAKKVKIKTRHFTLLEMSTVKGCGSDISPSWSGSLLQASKEVESKP